MNHNSDTLEQLGQPLQTQLVDILDLTTSMLEAASNDDWQRVIDLEVRRRPLLVNLSPSPSSSSAAALLADCIEQILQADARVIELGKRSREGLAAELGDINRGRSAQKAYSSDE